MCLRAVEETWECSYLLSKQVKVEKKKIEKLGPVKINFSYDCQFVCYKLESLFDRAVKFLLADHLFDINE